MSKSAKLSNEYLLERAVDEILGFDQIVFFQEG